jgi:hypothetical protein
VAVLASIGVSHSGQPGAGPALLRWRGRGISARFEARLMPVQFGVDRLLRSRLQPPGRRCCRGGEWLLALDHWTFCDQRAGDSAPRSAAGLARRRPRVRCPVRLLRPGHTTWLFALHRAAAQPESSAVLAATLLFQLSPDFRASRYTVPDPSLASDPALANLTRPTAPSTQREQRRRGEVSAGVTCWASVERLQPLIRWSGVVTAGDDRCRR